MGDGHGQSGERIPAWVLWVTIPAAGLLTLAGVNRFSILSLLSGVTAVGDGLVAALVVLAGAGFAWPVVRRLAPPSSPVGLRAITAALLGMWLISTAVLIAGSAFGGLLTAWLWWPVLGVGALLAVWHGRKHLRAWRPQARVPVGALIWVLVAVGVGLWLAGATRPPGTIGGTDGYDVLEYHLQVPREFYEAGRIQPLPHNVYSFYPLGVETLFLLAMILRGGAYEGVYAAKLLHGSFGVLAVAAVVVYLRRRSPARGRFAAALLATTPLVLHLSWLAMVELAMLAYLAVALFWLHQWAESRSWRAACLIGLMAGCACAAKYLSVGFVVAPLLVVLIAWSLWDLVLGRPGRRRKSMPTPGDGRWHGTRKGDTGNACGEGWRAAHPGHVVVAVVAALVTFCPWLIRNVTDTGNPVFPLATRWLGAGHWNEESERRWVDGHGPTPLPPVPRPPGWHERPNPGRVVLFWRNFLNSERFGPLVLLAAGAVFCVSLVFRRRAEPWQWMLAAVALIQLFVWAAFMRDMPSRFLVPIAVPICLLAGRLVQWPAPGSDDRPAIGRWRRWVLRPVTAGVLVTAMGFNLYASVQAFRMSTRSEVYSPLSRQDLAARTPFSQWKLPPEARLMLVGEARGFYFPPGTIYATTFDAHPLDQILRAHGTTPAALDKLRQLGITHVWVDWSEIRRLSRTYGYPASLTADVLANTPPRTSRTVFDRLGLRKVPHPPARDGSARAGRPPVSLYAVPR